MTDWIYQWWTYKHIWRYWFEGDESSDLRPTENEAFNNLAQQALLASDLRYKRILARRYQHG